MDDLNISVRRKKKRKRLLAILLLIILGAIFETGRRFRPQIRREIDYRMAIRDLESGRLDQAEIRLDTLVSAKPRETRARLALVRLYRIQGRITEAEETLQRAVELGLPIDEARPEHDRLQRVRQASETLTDR